VKRSRSPRIAGLALLGTVVLVSLVLWFTRHERAAVPSAAAADTAWQRDSEQWRAERDQSLRDPEGWFSLVGLFWLEQGENGFGSAEGNAIRLPADRAPARAGTFVRRGKDVEIRIRDGVTVTADGAPVTRLELASDAEGKPTMLALGSLRFHVIQRGERLGVRVKDRESPALAAFDGIASYPLDGRWRVPARFERYDPPKEIDVPNVTGDVNKEQSLGALVFERDGAEHRVDVLAEPGDDEYWVIFADQTTGRGTYGGGRFLYVPVAGSDGHTTIDFNRAYNPPCAFTPYATCPLPPKQNRLALAVEAGERDYGGAH
jgi:uncharacterized protein (DUF1684 family)